MEMMGANPYEFKKWEREEIKLQRREEIILDKEGGTRMLLGAFYMPIYACEPGVTYNVTRWWQQWQRLAL